MLTLAEDAPHIDAATTTLDCVLRDSQSTGMVVVTSREGESIVISRAVFDEIQRQLDLSELFSGVDAAEKEIDEGNFIEAEDALAAARLLISPES